MGVNELVLKEIEMNLVASIVIIHSSCRKRMFSQVCVKNSVHRGTWMAGGIYSGSLPSVMCMASIQGLHGRGGACMVGGMCGRGYIGGGMCGKGARAARRAFYSRGHVWQERWPLQQTVRILL